MRIRELERLYGIESGSNQYSDGYEKNSYPKTQEFLASNMNMDVCTLQNYKLLAYMMPELEDLSMLPRSNPKAQDLDLHY
ncbi:MAG: hypothetical protein LBS02_17630 [Hungatella sp.]|nr:hypothetical protein [Hungatella sp.]